nr:hypothetical protein Iba_chr02bCG11810 [Ipomoea batatas]
MPKLNSASKKSPKGKEIKEYADIFPKDSWTNPPKEGANVESNNGAKIFIQARSGTHEFLRSPHAPSSSSRLLPHAPNHPKPTHRSPCRHSPVHSRDLHRLPCRSSSSRSPPPQCNHRLPYDADSTTATAVNVFPVIRFILNSE